MIRPVVLWFRDDLRLADHAALCAALKTGRPVLPVYVLDDEGAGPWAMGGAARWWLHHSLVALTEALRACGAPLVLRRGAAVREIQAVVSGIGASDVFTGGLPDPSARATDRTLAKALAPSGVTLHRLRTTMLFAPLDIRSASGAPYSVYTPFAKACLTRGPHPVLPAPARIPAPPPPPSDRLEAWSLLPAKPDWASGLRATWAPGESGARDRLARFLADGISVYATARDRPDQPGTSMLSPHLHFGEISAAEIWQRAGSRRTAFVRELLWREFSIHQLWRNPDLPDAPVRPRFAAMPWRRDADGLRAWQRGQTGIPIVDAGMRQLWQTGWMHNRVRMIVASFLVKHLLIDWRDGEAWFWDTLVDADLPNNAANWQWVAGSGADAAPYFRVFNPVLQGRKFDPDGAYTRRYVPELRNLDTRYIHAPWEAPDEALNKAGIVPGKTYPHPIVDLALGRARALAAFAALRAG
jgi:deoxyribodipyrimidine photo-lyase